MHVTHLWYFQKTENKSIVSSAEKSIPAPHPRRQLSATGHSEHTNPLPGNFRIQEMGFYDLHVICDFPGRFQLEWKSPQTLRLLCTTYWNFDQI